MHGLSRHPLANPAIDAPDVHIFTRSKQPWVVLPPNMPAVPEYYDRNALWPAESLERMRILRQGA